MQEQSDEAAEPTEDETTDGTEGAAGDSEIAAVVDQQAAESDGTAAEQAPEVPDDASATISRAQEHIDNLDMNEEREAAKRAT